MARPRDGENLEPHSVVAYVPLEREPFFAGLDMSGQSPLGDAETSLFSVALVHIDQPAEIDAPQSAEAHDRALDFARLAARLRPAGTEPANVEHLPLLDGTTRTSVRRFTAAKLLSITING